MQTRVIQQLFLMCIFASGCKASTRELQQWFEQVPLQEGEKFQSFSSALAQEAISTLRLPGGQFSSSSNASGIPEDIDEILYEAADFISGDKQQEFPQPATQNSPTVQAPEFQFVDPQCQYDEIDQECIVPEMFGGTIARPERFPYMVSLQISAGSNSGCFVHFCGASLIAPDILLTAAHCVQEVAPTAARQGQLYLPIYASLAPLCRHLESSIVGSPSRVRVSQYIIHPDYTRVSLESDIALLKLDQSLSLSGPFARYKAVSNAEITGIPDPNQNSTLISLSGVLETNRDSLTVIGYGDINPVESRSKEYNVRYMRSAKLQYVPDTLCRAMLENTSATRQLIPDKMLCAFSERADSCSGDSGGPLVITGVGQDLNEEESYEHDYQVGIVSWGPGEACTIVNRQFVGVYTELQSHVDWIDTNMYQFQSIGSGAVEGSLPMGRTDADSNCRTQNGCYCKQFWQYQGQTFNGCDNPDQDGTGNWCIVNSLGCNSRPSGTMSVTGEFWDRCSCQDETTSDDGCPSTILGCRCRQSWNHSKKEYRGCANPDNDPIGDWCYIQGDFSNCTSSDGVQVSSRLVTSQATGEI
eukprot:TRINITY_DN24862_c0_g1_i4.p1 TRINITY_DN24862_c0_g1~~TRINITY_DN24862_c0_g1_i4.p1  ORF type:complete len:585 (-),score=39.37 TRINITY_DN24862_c0_g1_i4:148-1902(-)